MFQRKIGLVTTIAAAITATVLMSAPAAEAATPAPVHELQVYYDQNGKRIPYRQGTWNGSKGFGYAKISTYHGVKNLSSVAFAIHNPAGGAPVSGGAGSSDFEYYAWANKGYRDSAGTVHYTDSVELLAVARLDYQDSYYGVVIKGVPGVITSYCQGYNPVCPSWVDQAFSSGGAVVSGASSSTNTESSAGSSTSDSVVSASYKPLSANRSSSAGTDVDQNAQSLNGDTAN